MPESIIPCDGEDQKWLLADDEGNPTEPTCPGTYCGLTAKELGIKVTMRTLKGVKTPNPLTVPGHEIAVEGQDLRYVLAGGDFKVHTPTCPTLKRDLGKSDYEKPGIMVAANPKDAILSLWDDQIRESGDILDPDDPTDEELNAAGFYNSTDFHRCVSRLDGFGVAKTAKTAVTKKISKQMLATRLIEVMAKEIDRILDSNLAGTTKGEKEAALILSGMGNAEIRQTAANWVHHFPADRDRWVQSGFAVPVRSDWIGFEPNGNGGEATEAEDDLELEDAGDDEDTE